MTAHCICLQCYLICLVNNLFKLLVFTVEHSCLAKAAIVVGWRLQGEGTSYLKQIPFTMETMHFVVNKN